MTICSQQRVKRVMGLVMDPRLIDLYNNLGLINSLMSGNDEFNDRGSVDQ